VSAQILVQVNPHADRAGELHRRSIGRSPYGTPPQQVGSPALSVNLRGEFWRAPAALREPVACFALLLAYLVAGCGGMSASGQPGQQAAAQPALRDEWVDPDTGHRIVRLSRIPGSSQSFYFHQNAFTATGDKMVFENSSPGAGSRLMVLDWATRKIEPLTEPGTRGIVVGRSSRQVYYQRWRELYSTHLDTHAIKLIAELPFRWSVATVNADETKLAGTFTEAGGRPIDRSGPRSGWFEQVFEAKRPHWLYTVDVASGRTNAFYRREAWLNHLQFSPTDTNLLMFCHEGPWHKLDRIWNIRTDGTGLRLMHKRSIAMEIAGHEFWSPDGKTVWFDLQMPRGEKFFLAGVEVATGKETRYPVQRDQWSVHFNISRDGKLFAGDGGAPNMVAKAPNGKWIWLFTPQPDTTLKAEKLVNMARHDYSLEPNVNFSPDGKWVVFRGNFDGSPQVYAVEVAKAGVAGPGSGAVTAEPKEPAAKVSPGALPATGVQRRFVIGDHGAVGDGRALSTKSIQAAIDRCSAEGGGAVVVPKGTFLTGAIFLKQGVNLRIEKDGVLKGSQNTNDYPWIETRIAGLEMKWPAALVNADGMNGFELSGEGTIDGSGERWWREYWDARSREQGGTDPHFKVPRPRLVHIIRSRNVVVRDLSFTNPAFWNLQVTYCDGVELRDLKIRAHGEPVKAASSDGIDIDSTRNVLIKGCDIECDDDAICLKSGRDADGLRVNRPTENVVIRNCRVGQAAGLVVFGSETSGGIRNVRIYDCKAGDGCGEVVRFKTRMGRGGVVEDVLYENIEADGARMVFNFNMEAFSTTWLPEEFRTPVPADKGTPIFRNIRVRNLRATNCGSAGRLVGLVDSPLRDLTLENVSIETKSGFTVRNARGLHFENVKVNGVPVAAPRDTVVGERRGNAIGKPNES
jgi:oligogalacturonide lyase